MPDAAFRDAEWRHRYDVHIEPINRLVDTLQAGRGWLPYVAPMYGGTDARLLNLFRDPAQRRKRRAEAACSRAGSTGPDELESFEAPTFKQWDGASLGELRRAIDRRRRELGG